jgi:hypothetical protein
MDLKITIILTVFVIILSLIVFIFSKKKLFSLFLASLLSNVIWFYGIDFNLSEIFNLKFIFHFSRIYWPIINLFLFIILIFIYVKNIKKNKK